MIFARRGCVIGWFEQVLILLTSGFLRKASNSQRVDELELVRVRLGHDNGAREIWGVRGVSHVYTHESEKRG